MIVNFETFSDADFVQSFLYKTAALAPIDLLTDSLRMMVRINPADPTSWIECSTWNSRILVTDHAAGAFTLTIPVSILVNLPPGIYVHSLVKTSVTALTRKDLWRGTLTHSAGPTRWKLGTL